MKKEKVVAILLGRLELKLKADSNTGSWIVLEALTCCWNCGLLCLSVAVLSFSMSRTSSIAGVVTCSVQWKECFCVWFTLFYYRVCHHSSRTTNLKRRVGVSDWKKKKAGNVRGAMKAADHCSFYGFPLRFCLFGRPLSLRLCLSTTCILNVTSRRLSLSLSLLLRSPSSFCHR